MDKNLVSERLKIALSNSKLSQAEVVKKTNISKGALSSYLSGRYIPKQSNIYKLAELFDVNPAWLMGYDSIERVEVEIAGGKMDNGGFIVLNRKILEWGWYNDINTFYLFFHCLMKANWKEGTFEGQKIPRGSFVTSLTKLSEETKLSVQCIRTAIKHLNSTGEITSKSYSKYRIITVNNYNKYQDYNKETNIQLTSKQQATNKQLTTIEQINKETKKQIYTSSSIGEENLFDFIESNFGRTLSPIEYEEVMRWEDNELTRYAIKQAVISNKCGIKYIARIISAYQRENVKTVQQAQEREREYVVKQKKSRGSKYKTSSERIEEVAERFLSEE